MDIDLVRPQQQAAAIVRVQGLLDKFEAARYRLPERFSRHGAADIDAEQYFAQIVILYFG